MFNIKPMDGSDVAVLWDHLYGFLVGLSVFFFILVVGGMLYFVWKYRDKPGAKAKYIVDNHKLEIIWTIIPTILLLVIFAWGYSVYKSMIDAPSGAMEVRVVGKQWLWQFQYDDGRMSVGELIVPVNKPVKLIMSSEDVLHSFFVPNFRIKQDVVPGIYTTAWFEAKVTGVHHIFCTEYCGASHSMMEADIYAVSEEEWNQFKNGKELKKLAAETPRKVYMTPQEVVAGGSQLKTVSLAQQGKALSATKGCIACHSDDGSQKIGPSYKGIAGATIELADGSKVVADDNYLRESILQSSKKVVKGFNPVMPSFQGLITETELNALIAYIKSLK